MQTEHNTLETNILKSVQVFLRVLRISFVNDHCINGYQWRILIVRRSGLAERYNAALCALPLDLTAGSAFITPIFIHIHLPATVCSLN